MKGGNFSIGLKAIFKSVAAPVTPGGNVVN